MVCDPSGGGLLFVLAELAERRFLVHPGPAQRGVNGCYHYRAELVRLAALDSVQPVQTDGNAAFPATLSDTVAPAGRHGSINVVSALARCMVELYSARVALRGLDFSDCIDTNPLEWPGTFWDCKLLLVWQDSEGTNHASVGPCIYTLMKDCSGARSMASSERP